MKNLLFLLTIPLLLFTSQLSAQSSTWVSDPCDCPREDDNIINVIARPNERIIEFTALTAQAYQWEICGPFGEIISGANSQTVITKTNPNILEDWAVVIYLTRFQDGECTQICLYADVL